MKIIKNKTNRGFGLIEFTDDKGEKCSIQKSSLALKQAIWFGCDKFRMHLTRSEVKKLIPILQLFVDTGEIMENKKIGSGGYIGEAEIENARGQCKCIRIVGSSEWFTNGCPIHELKSKN